MSSRMSAEDRREQIVVAATRAFSRGGFAGTSTDAVAKEAGVSQPYVVRTFGTKLELFLEVLERACAQVALAFGEVLDAAPFDPEDDEDWGRLAMAYTELLRDRDLLMVMMHGFAAGGIDEVASRAREGMGRIYATVMRTGCSEERAVDFFAQGMLLNVMLSMRAPEHLEADALLTPLTHCAFGESLELLT